MQAENQFLITKEQLKKHKAVKRLAIILGLIVTSIYVAAIILNLPSH